MTLLAISLDLDDTLWPSKPVLIHAEQVLGDWLEENAPRTKAWMTPEARREVRDRLLAEFPHRAHDVSFLRRESLRAAMEAAGDDPSLAHDAFEVFLEARQRVTLYDDVAGVLGDWSSRYRLIAISNGNGDVERIGIDHWFAARVSAHDLDFGKPDPRIYQEACRRAGVEPAAVLHIGDDLDLDVRAALSAGMRAAWLRRTDRRHPPASEAPAGVGVFENLADLDAHLRAVAK